MDSAYPKTHRIHHPKVSGRKVNFPDVFWWPSWIYADYESCPKLPSCSRTPLDYEPPKKVHTKELF